jgi:hypothetical protein
MILFYSIVLQTHHSCDDRCLGDYDHVNTSSSVCLVGIDIRLAQFCCEDPCVSTTAASLPVPAVSCRFPTQTRIVSYCIVSSRLVSYRLVSFVSSFAHSFALVQLSLLCASLFKPYTFVRSCSFRSIKSVASTLLHRRRSPAARLPPAVAGPREGQHTGGRMPCARGQSPPLRAAWP